MYGHPSQDHAARHRWPIIAVSGVSLLLALAAAPAYGQTDGGASASDGGYQQLTLEAADYTFGWPETVQAGRTVITMENGGQDVHHAQLIKLNEGVTVDDAVAALGRMIEAEEAGGEEAAAAFAEFASLASVQGGPGIIVPGASQRLILDLEPGRYVWICGLPAAEDGEPHHTKGMIASFEVVAPETAVEAAEPAADGTLTLQDFAFALPETIVAGPQRWKVTNAGAQPHEALIAQLAPGASAMDFLTAFGDPTATEPPPGLPIGGLQAVMPGTTAWLDLDLAPGTYAAFCFVPDPGSGQPHLALGMVSEFTVEGEA
jgi:hypothetical protein